MKRLIFVIRNRSTKRKEGRKERKKKRFLFILLNLLNFTYIYLKNHFLFIIYLKNHDESYMEILYKVSFKKVSMILESI